MLKENGFRVKIDDRDEKLSYKMRESQTKKIPLTLILGDKEKDNDAISYRKFGMQETNTLNILEFIEKVNKCILEKEKNIN